MTAADRCRAVAEACCQILAPDEPWWVVITASEFSVLVEICAAGHTFGKLVGTEGMHADAMRVLVTAAGRRGRGEIRVRCWVYDTERQD
jgi:predicted RNA-binding protein YlqC (UPF0109 family)